MLSAYARATQSSTDSEDRNNVLRDGEVPLPLAMLSVGIYLPPGEVREQVCTAKSNTRNRIPGTNCTEKADSCVCFWPVCAYAADAHVIGTDNGHCGAEARG
eukprot:12584-Rhodomonas_salina.1